MEAVSSNVGEKLPQRITVTTETGVGNSVKLKNIHKLSVGYTLLLDIGTIVTIDSLASKFKKSSTEIINENLHDGVFPIKSDCKFQTRFQNVIRKTKIKIRSLKGGRSRKMIMDQKVHLHVFDDEIRTAEEILQEQSNVYLARVNSLYNELLVAQKKINDVENKNELQNEIIKSYEQSNTYLNEYVEKLRHNFVNKGKEIGDCKSRNQTQKKVSMLKDRVQKALWFAKSFGVEFQEIKVVDKNGKSYQLTNETCAVSNYNQLDDSEKEKVKRLLYILDSFGISDDAYHELSLQNETLTRSYLIKQCRDDLNQLCCISKTPGDSPGAQLNLTETIDMLIEKNVNSGVDEIPIVQLKVAVDGAKMSRVSNFLVCSLAILNAGEEVMSVHGQYTLAIIDAKENFVSIGDSLSDIFRDLNGFFTKQGRRKLHSVYVGIRKTVYA